MKTAPPMYDQVRRGITRNRVLGWLAAHSYRSAAVHGARFGAMIGLGIELIRLIPGLSPRRPFSFRSSVADVVVSTLVGTVMVLLATAVARTVIRAYARARLGRGSA